MKFEKKPKYVLQNKTFITQEAIIDSVSINDLEQTMVNKSIEKLVMTMFSHIKRTGMTGLFGVSYEITTTNENLGILLENKLKLYDGGVNNETENIIRMCRASGKQRRCGAGGEGIPNDVPQYIRRRSSISNG